MIAANRDLWIGSVQLDEKKACAVRQSLITQSGSSRANEWTYLGARGLGLMIVIGAAIMGGPAALDLLLEKTLDAKITASRPLCSVSWTSTQRVDDKPVHKTYMNCGDVAAFRSRTSDATQWRVVEGMELSASYVSPTGSEAVFKQFVPTSSALPAIRDGHVPISYRAERPIVAVIPGASRNSDLRWMLLMAGAGLLFLFAKELHALRARLFPSIDRSLGAQFGSSETNSVSSISLPLKAAAIAFLPAVFLLSVVLHQNIALFLRPILLIAVVVAVLARWRRK